jgi:hypothetical protein
VQALRYYSSYLLQVPAAAPVAKFASGVIDTSSKFATGVIDASEDLQKFELTLLLFSRDWGKMIQGKNLKQKIS